MNLKFKIAKRYLLSKKNHSVINIISIICAVAIGIGCAALIIVLSVFNGFSKIITLTYSAGAPDYTIEKQSGKILNLSETPIADFIEYSKGLGSVNGENKVSDKVKSVPVAEESAYLQYDNIQRVALIKGMPKENVCATIGANLAYDMEIDLEINDSITIYLPSRTGDISIVMPMESVWSETVQIEKIIQYSNDRDNQLFVPLEVAQDLLEYEPNEVNRLEIYIDSTLSRRERSVIEKKLRSIDSKEYLICNFLEQNSTIYKMMRAEKLAVYLILLFIIIIIAVNIISSIAMMIIDKQDDIKTFESMGGQRSFLQRIFTLHGVMICSLGAIIGVIIGLIICVLQQRFGFISMPGNFIVSSYPVDVKLSDIIIIMVGVFSISLLMSYIPSRTIVGEHPTNQD